MENIFDLIIENALILIPALIIIGKLLKEIMIFPDKWIPLALLPLGIAGVIGLNGFSVDTIIQGVLVTGTAVYGNQIVKQLRE